MFHSLQSFIVGATLVVLAGCALQPLFAVAVRRMRRQGLAFAVVATGFLVAMGTKPEPGPEPTPVVVTNTVTFVEGEHGYRTGGGELVQRVIQGQDATAPEITANEGWSFTGWDRTFTDVQSDLTVTAQYAAVEPEPEPPTPAPIAWRLAPTNDVPPDLSVANVYDGYAYDAAGSIAATVQVKSSKLSKGVSKVTATVVWAGTGKKTSFKGGLADGTGEVTEMVSGYVPLNAKLGAVGLTGTLGDYTLDGSRNVFSAKDEYAKDVAAAVTVLWKDNYNVAWTNEYGLNVLNVSVAAKGKTKVSGTLANGAKVSASAQLSAGRDGDPCGIPVLIAKKAQLAFVVWLTEDGLSVTGLDGATVSPIEGLTKACAFTCDTNELAEAILLTQSGADRVLTDYLPNGLSVVQTAANKWIVDDGHKAGKVVVDKKTGEILEDKSKIDGFNVSGLKFTYTAKTGAFKGSFKAYYVVRKDSSKGASYSVKSVSMTVSGVVLDGIGLGTMTNTKVGTFDVSVR